MTNRRDYPPIHEPEPRKDGFVAFSSVLACMMYDAGYDPNNWDDLHRLHRDSGVSETTVYHLLVGDRARPIRGTIRKLSYTLCRERPDSYRLMWLAAGYAAPSQIAPP